MSMEKIQKTLSKLLIWCYYRSSWKLGGGKGMWEKERRTKEKKKKELNSKDEAWICNFYSFSTFYISVYESKFKENNTAGDWWDTKAFESSEEQTHVRWLQKMELESWAEAWARKAKWRLWRSQDFLLKSRKGLQETDWFKLGF